MLPEEYDHLISDPSDYMLRTYLPRTVGAFAGFANLSSLFDFIELPFVFGQVGGWGSPEMAAGLKKTGQRGAEPSRVGQSRLPGDGRGHGSGLPAVSPARPPRRPSTSWATPCAAPRASSSTCSAAPTRCWPPATGWCRSPSTGRSSVRAPRHAGLLHPAAQGRRRLHERRAVPDLLLADAAHDAARSDRRRHDPVPVRRGPLQHAGSRRSWTCPRARPSGCSTRPTWPGPSRPIGTGGLHPGQRAPVAAACGHRRAVAELHPQAHRRSRVRTAASSWTSAPWPTRARTRTCTDDQDRQGVRGLLIHRTRETRPTEEESRQVGRRRHPGLRDDRGRSAAGPGGAAA